jgi:hypothetical protein
MFPFLAGIVFLSILAWIGAILLKPFGLVNISWAMLLAPIGAVMVFVLVYLAGYIALFLLLWSAGAFNV